MAWNLHLPFIKDLSSPTNSSPEFLSPKHVNIWYLLAPPACLSLGWFHSTRSLASSSLCPMYYSGDSRIWWFGLTTNNYVAGKFMGDRYHTVSLCAVMLSHVIMFNPLMQFQSLSFRKNWSVEIYGCTIMTFNLWDVLPPLNVAPKPLNIVQWTVKHLLGWW
jgi:hypothetical protein